MSQPGAQALPSPSVPHSLSVLDRGDAETGPGLETDAFLSIPSPNSVLTVTLWEVSSPVFPHYREANRPNKGSMPLSAEV